MPTLDGDDIIVVIVALAATTAAASMLGMRKILTYGVNQLIYNTKMLIIFADKLATFQLKSISQSSPSVWP